MRGQGREHKMLSWKRLGTEEGSKGHNGKGFDKKTENRKGGRKREWE